MALFRFILGSLADSIETVVEVQTLNDVAKLLDPAPKELRCKYYCFDKRINWHTWLIIDDAGYNGPVGMSSAKLEWKIGSLTEVPDFYTMNG